MGKRKGEKKRNKDHRETSEPEAPSVAGPTEASPPGKMRQKEYQRELRRLHGELVAMQEWVKATGAKICIVFEGRDTAGKGGTIKAITERVSPRVFRVIALPAPTEREKSQMYIQRYLPHFPAAGEVVIFDRSWYNRAGVERVMGFCTEHDVAHFLDAAPGVEKAMVDSGILLLKYWLEVSPDEQTRRLQSRIDDPRKIWKLSDMDLLSYSRWFDYSQRPRRHVRSHRHRLGAVVDRALRRQEAGSPQHHLPPARAGSRTNRWSPRRSTLPERDAAGDYRRPGHSAAVRPDGLLRSSRTFFVLQLAGDSVAHVAHLLHRTWRNGVDRDGTARTVIEPKPQ